MLVALFEDEWPQDGRPHGLPPLLTAHGNSSQKLQAPLAPHSPANSEDHREDRENLRRQTHPGPCEEEAEQVHRKGRDNTVRDRIRAAKYPYRAGPCPLETLKVVPRLGKKLT
jgi:hypothetical protein